MTHPRFPFAAKKSSQSSMPARLLALALLALPAGLAAQDEPPPPPPPSTEFGSLIVRQNDELNTSTSMTMFRGPGGTLRWEPVWMSSSKADYFLTFFNDNDFEAGTVIASVAENGRDNSAFGDSNLGIGPFRATVSAAASPGSGQPTSYFLATSGAYAPGLTSANGGEVNVNLSFAYFPYHIWLGGNAWIFDRANGAMVDRLTGTEGLVLGTHLINTAGGRYLLDLRSHDPDATPANGIVLVNHAKNEDNYGSGVANADGTFTLRVRDNGTSGAGTEQDPVTFVYIPKSMVGQENLLAMGRVLNNGTSAVKGGDYSVAHVATGTWHLTIPDQNPNTGTLVISGGGAGNMEDNIVSYQWNELNGCWVIQACDIISAATLPVLENGGAPWEEIFSFAFFEAPLIPEVKVTAPTQGQTYYNIPASFTVSAEASDYDGVIEKVEFFRNGRYLGESLAPPYDFEESGVQGGLYLYQAKAWDDQGQAPYSTPVGVRVTYDPLDKPDNTALFFDGLVEHARTPVVAPQFGVGGPPTRGLTLECWFRKEGAGATAGSGSGGITVHPLIAKGRGESDNNTTDCNYLFGVTMDGLIAADFEAYPTPGVVAGGANFPVYGTHEPIQNGRWYHAAVTYDGDEGVWKLFLDGEQVGMRTTVPGAMPRYDSNHAFAIGAAMNTSTQRAGSFFGAIDEVRVWSYVRTPEEILATKDASVLGAAGLVARFGMDEGEGELVTSSGDGTVVQVFGPVDEEEGGEVPWEPLWVPGAPLTNQAPQLALLTPQNGEALRGTTPILITAEASDADGSVDKVEFFDGSTLLAEFTEAPYQFVWTDAAPGPHRVRAVATDDAGAVSLQDAHITVVAPTPLLLTEVQSNQSPGAPAGVGDYWELTNFGSAAVSLAGYTWHDSGRNRQAALAWALPAGTSIAAGESIVFTGADPALFRTWWGLDASVRVIQSVGAPGLGQNDGVVLYDNTGAEVFYFNYAPGGFTRANGLPALGGHAGTSGGGHSTDALVWEPNSGLAWPRYMAAGDGINGGVTAPQGGDVGSPGGPGGGGADPAVLLALQVSPAVFSENAANPAAVGTVTRYGDVSDDLLVFLLSGDVSEAAVPVSVVIPAGQSSASFDVTAVDDILADGSQQVTLTATAANASLATFTVTVLDDGDAPVPLLLLTEIQSNQSDSAPGGANDYWELTNYGTTAVNLEGFTWDDDSRSYATGLAWAFPAGTIIEPGESAVITIATPADFRAWWGIDASVKVLQTPGAPGLGQNDGIAFFDNTGRELFYVSYAAGGFTRPDGSPATGGHAGVSGGGSETDALVWDVASGVAAPRYVAAQTEVLGAFQAANGTDVGSPGSGALDIAQKYTLQLLHLSDAQAVDLALDTAPLLAALTEAFEVAYDNTLIVAGGDSFIPGAFLYAGADPLLDAVPAVGKTALGRPDIAIHNLIGVEASAIGVHEWDLGSEVFVDAIRPDEDWTGAQFPYLAANLNYSADSAALTRFSDVPLDETATEVPEAAGLKGRLAPVTVVDKNGEKIGLVGVTTQMLASLSSPSGTVVAGATAVDLDLLAGQVQAYVDELLDEGINKIILLSHLRQLGLEQALAGKLRGVDIILAAGSHTRLGDADDTPAAFPGHAANFAGGYPVLAQDELGEPLLIVSTDSEFTYLGRLLVDFDLDGRIVPESLDAYRPEAGAYAATSASVAAAWGVSVAALESTAFAPGTKGAAVREVTEAVRTVIEAKEGTVYGYTAVHLEGEAKQVRSQETNLGNLTADANLEVLRAALGGGDAPLVSLKNGGSIRTPIGVVAEGADGSVSKQPPPGNAALGKPVGGVSQLDLESALRFNRALITFETTATGLKTLLEHGLAQWPDQSRFPQVGGVMFAWDPARPAGDRITSIALLNADGSAGPPLYKAGPLGAAILEQGPSLIRVVTLNFLANGGDEYPAKTHGENFRYLLADGTLGPVIDKGLDFTAAPQLPGNAAGEQAALAGYLQAWHGTLGTAYVKADTGFELDERIQNLAFRADTVPPEAGRDSDGDGLTDLEELAMGGHPYAALRVGDYVDLDLSLWRQAGQTLRLTGKLPKGLKFDPVTGRLSGLITGLSGLYDLQLQLLNGKVVEGTVSLPLAVGAFPSRLLAGYEALLEDDTGLPLGIARLSVTKPGAWSGSVNLAGQPKRSAKGTFELIPGEQKAEVTMLLKATKTLPEMQVKLLLDAGNALVEGGFEDTSSLTGDARGLRLAGFGANPPLVRRLNLALDAGPQDGVDYPAGFGWARGTVNKSGAVSMKGQLGDAQAATLAMKLGANGQALIWVQPYKNKASYFGGVADLPDLGQAQPAPEQLVAGAQWLKVADAREKAYDGGFAAALPVAVLSSAFNPVKTSAELEVVLGLTASLLNLEIDGGGLSNAPGATPELPAAWTLDSKFALLSTAATPWKGKVVKTDGAVTGTFTLPAGAENLAGKAAVSGVLLPAGADVDVIGAGLVKVPVAGAKGTFRTASVILQR